MNCKNNMINKLNSFMKNIWSHILVCVIRLCDILFIYFAWIIHISINLHIMKWNNTNIINRDDIMIIIIIIILYAIVIITNILNHSHIREYCVMLAVLKLQPNVAFITHNVWWPIFSTCKVFTCCVAAYARRESTKWMAESYANSNMTCQQYVKLVHARVLI